MVVLEYPYVHRWYPATTVDPDTCATFETLKAERLENVVGNMNVSDFATTMERRTNATASTGMNRVPVFLHCMKHARRGHDKAGLKATALGQGAVICWVCPYDGRNLPAGWHDVEAKYRFLYMLLIALDTNLKLKNRMQANTKFDPPLGPGWEYFVEPKAYKEHLRSYVPEKDISSCIAFAALLQKNTRSTVGLRVAGVGGCVCACHDYANMDFILFSALLNFSLFWLTISYDIACQWHKNLLARMEKLPAPLQLPMKDIKWQCALPVWHAGSHEEDCRNTHSLSVKPGVGKSDGEGNIGLGATSYLARGASTPSKRLQERQQYGGEGVVNQVAERYQCVVGGRQQTKSLHPQQIWCVSSVVFVDTFCQSQFLDTPTEAEVCAALKRDEEAGAAAGCAPLHGTSTTAFLTAGMQLEDAQRRILAELKGLALVAPDRESRIQEQRLAFLAKLEKFRTLQAVFMPGIARLLASAEAVRDPETPPPRAEKINSHITGQNQATKANTLQAQVSEHVEDCAQKYRKGYSTLVKLQGDAINPQFRKLNDSDILLNGDDGESDRAARKKLAMIGSGRGARAPRMAPGTSKKVMSWVWTVQGGAAKGEEALHASVCVEWCRVCAHKVRWEEEVWWVFGLMP
ncbi:hypothetical protein B0H16DRAFT_1477307 [Mycena metata]|uniref:CxC2-like cysteine cluster KDZ transposase-associated domain-containing protein n=1 Tax=Mycena metata TaxID=1033252 RepID=A0AAD7MG90_9AGAR|nr:hypothetical protein B0H16DRAFT_1477307 [Mycena metata]